MKLIIAIWALMMGLYCILTNNDYNIIQFIIGLILFIVSFHFGGRFDEQLKNKS